MIKRPVRIRIINELNNQQTLPADRGQFEVVPGGADVVFLGLGPEPGKLSDLFPEIQIARYVECEGMKAQISGWEDNVPDGFSPMDPAGFDAATAKKATIIRYRPGLKAFPSFWGPLTARVAVARSPQAGRMRSVWLPFDESDLLGKELTLAFEAAGYVVRTLSPEALERSPCTVLPDLLAQETPALFFSVNFKGLEPFGLGYNLLREAGVAVGIWLVDNPFHLLTSVKSAYWREAQLFVTDNSFIEPLLAAGGRHVTHLPLAACPQLLSQGNLPEHGRGIKDRLVFVGRSEFPKKNKYFAGLTPNERLLGEAMVMLDRGERPHFLWWQDHIRVALWPGNAVRHVGVGAEVVGRAWRQRCLAAIGPDGVIFGDDKWGHLPGIRAETRGPLDYYAHLPAVYREAAVSLNVTGMQLPAGLTQRHFDVWCAGGFLLTDANPGLSIFPHPLVEQVQFTTPAEILPLFESFRQDSAEKQELKAAWQRCILAEHTYDHRVATVLKTMALPIDKSLVSPLKKS